jgi:hypothetical protein
MNDFIQIIKLAPLSVLTYPLYVALKVFFTLLSYALSPLLAAYSVVAGVTKLPGFLQYFSTLDDDLDGGQHQHADLYPAGATGLKLWWQRTRWICRNPAAGWNAVVLGFDTAGHTVVWESAPNPTSIDFGKGGKVYANVMQSANGTRYFTYRRNWSLGSTKYLKQWFGWNYMAYDGKHLPVNFMPISIKAVQ